MTDVPPNNPAFSAAADPAEGARDLRPAVDAIVAGIHAQRAAGGPVVVMLLEAHTMASHVMLSQLVMERLRETDPHLKIAHGLERSHDLLDTFEGQSGTGGALAAADTDGSRLLNHLLVEPREAARVTRRNLLEYCQTHTIPIRAIDAAGTPDGHLDQSDPTTRAVIQAHAPELLDTPVHGNSTEGIRLRNLVAVDRIQAHMQDTAADVYILPYGAAHGHGWKRSEEQNIEGFPAEASLDALFKARGVTPLIVLPNFTIQGIAATTMLPDNADLSNTIILEGIPNNDFWQKPENTPQENAHIEVAEARFLQATSQQSGGALQLFARTLSVLSNASGGNSAPLPSPPPP